MEEKSKLSLHAPMLGMTMKSKVMKRAKVTHGLIYSR